MIRKLFIVLVAAICFVSSCATIQSESTLPLKVACIGDSITYGNGIKDRDKDSYPAQLGVLLGDKYMVVNFGVSGATMLKKGNKPYWQLDEFQTAQDFNPDIVIIKLGTNDTKPINWKYKEEFESNYVEMIKMFQSLDSKPTVWISRPIPVFPERWGISDKVVKEEVIPLVDKVAKESGVSVIDLYQPFVGKPELVPDKVHPNVKGAGIIAEIVAEVIASSP